MIDGSLAQRLADASPEVRRRAVRDLGALPWKGAGPHVLAALGDDDWRVRKEAIALFAGSGASGAVGAALLSAMEQEQNVGLRNAAAEALCQLSGEAIDAVVARLPDLGGTALKMALEVVGRSSDPRAADILVEYLESGDSNVSATAAELLGDRGGEVAAAALSRCLVRPDAVLVLASLQSLNRMGARVPFDVLEPLAETPVYGSELVTALGRSGDPTAAHVIVARLPADPKAARALVELHGASPRSAAAVEGAVGVAGAEALDALTRLAESSDFADRSAAVSCLMWARRTEHVPLLVSLAQNEALHARIVDGFAAWGAPALEALEAMLPQASGRTLASVIGLLGRLLDEGGGRRRAVLFTAFLNSADLVVATAAMGALARFGDEAVVPRLAELADSEDARVRRSAGRALSSLGGRYPEAVRRTLGRSRFDGDRSVDLLRVYQAVGRPEDASSIATALSSPSPALRRAAIGALASVAGKGAIDAISLSMTDESAEVREAAVAALSKLGPEASEMIVSALRTAEGPMRAALVRALGRVGHSEASSILRSAVRESARTAIASLEASALLGLGPLELKGELLSHPDAEVVKMALSAFDEMVTDSELVALLEARAWDVRLSAVERLSRRPDPEGAIAAALRRALDGEQNDLVRAALGRALAARVPR